jgi:DNA-binding CsgD family transcriptional regulator
LGLSQLQWLRLTQVLRLSGRECDVTRLILETQSEEAIATALSISRHTVHSYLERLYRKTAVKSRTELIIKLFATYIDLSSSASTGLYCAVEFERERGIPPSSRPDPAPPCATLAQLPDIQT